MIVKRKLKLLLLLLLTLLVSPFGLCFVGCIASAYISYLPDFFFHVMLLMDLVWELRNMLNIFFTFCTKTWLSSSLRLKEKRKLFILFLTFHVRYMFLLFSQSDSSLLVAVHGAIIFYTSRRGWSWHCKWSSNRLLRVWSNEQWKEVSSSWSCRLLLLLSEHWGGWRCSGNCVFYDDCRRLFWCGFLKKNSIIPTRLQLHTALLWMLLNIWNEKSARRHYELSANILQLKGLSGFRSFHVRLYTIYT